MNEWKLDDLTSGIAIYILLLTLTSWITELSWLLPIGVGIGFILLLLLILSSVISVPETFILGVGLANLITITRELIFILLILYNANLPNLIFTMLVTFVLISDMVDGEIARSRDESSKIGSILDIEADASYNLLMTYLMISSDLLPDWMIFVGIIRYIYILVLKLLPLQSKPERRSKLAIAISICYNVALAFLWSLPYWWFSRITQFLGLLILLSFLRDFLYRIDIMSR